MQGSVLIFKRGKVQKKFFSKFFRQGIILIFKNYKVQETSKETVSGTFRPSWRNYVPWERRDPITYWSSIIYKNHRIISDTAAKILKLASYLYFLSSVYKCMISKM